MRTSITSDNDYRENQYQEFQETLADDIITIIKCDACLEFHDVENNKVLDDENLCEYCYNYKTN